MSIIWTIVVVIFAVKWYDYSSRKLLKYYANKRRNDAVGLQILLKNIEDLTLLLIKPQVFLTKENVEDGYLSYARPESAFGTNNIAFLFNLEDTIKRNIQTRKLILSECDKMLSQMPENIYGLEAYISKLNYMRDKVNSIEYTHVHVYVNGNKGNAIYPVSVYSLEDMEKSIEVYKIVTCNEEE